MIKEAQTFKKYIIVAAIWNLSVPSILKSYLDHIVVSGETFKYTRYGVPRGLLKNKGVNYEEITFNINSFLNCYDI